MGLKDIFSPLGGLEKLKITAFEDDQYKKATKTYVVMYNPTTYSTEVKTNWIPEQGATPDGKQLQYKGNQSDKASFEFLFDATSASPPGEDVPGDAGQIGGEKISAIEIIQKDEHVEGAIQALIDMGSRIQGETHTPNHLQVNWGAYQFRGVLTGATINYKLFNNAGLPIRATVTVNLQESKSREEQAAEAQRNSPDLTHIRVVKSGETLPLIAEEVYGDPDYYLEIARVNNLNNFRNIPTGRKLILPPVNKKQA